MSKLFIEDSTLTAIGDAIREKTGSTDLIAPGDMPAEIKGIVSGGGDGECNGMHIPEEALTINAGNYNFAHNSWNWFLEETKGKLKITTSNGGYMFYGSDRLTEAPDFSVQVGLVTTPPIVLGQAFHNCNFSSPNITFYNNNSSNNGPFILGEMKPLPDFGDKQCIFTGDNTTIVGCAYQLFSGYKGQYPTWFFEELNWDYDAMRADKTTFGSAFPSQWSNCAKVRTIPILKELYATHDGGEYYTFWYQWNLNYCYSLEEVVLPRPGSLTFTSNKFVSKNNSLHRLKSFKFDVQEDGTPYAANWQKQTIDLTSFIGYTGGATSMTAYGYTEADVIDSQDDWMDYVDAPTGSRNWFSKEIGWSTFGVTAARELINTLPDTSAYLESSSGTTNTIKFNYRSAMNHPFEWLGSNLTEEDIAVATAKGWTVTLVD